MDYFQESVKLHRQLGGKLELKSKIEIRTKEDLSLAYTPGVAEVSRVVAENPSLAYELTLKKNTVAVFSDGSAVLGLGNIGPYGAIPVMEGKAILFKEYANIDAFPICVETQETEEIIGLVKNIAPVFAGINLEDISAPRCFEIENRLQDLGIPVFHDDQHGTAVVLLAALINSCKLSGKRFSEISVAINGAGAAGTAIARLLLGIDVEDEKFEPVKDVIICDSKGIVSNSREDIKNNKYKVELAEITNQENRSGSLADAVRGADVFIGVSVAGCLTQDMVRSMHPDPVILAMANPVPEIMPDLAKEAGAFIVGTGRSDFPNQVNNVLAFPGIFRGAIDARAKRITGKMLIAAAHALADSVGTPSVDRILPMPLDRSVAPKVASAVRLAWDE